MTRLGLTLAAFCLLLPKIYGQNQINVFQDAKGEVMSTLYNSPRATQFAYGNVTVLGSPFLTFPVWQEGKIQLGQQELTCDLAYNLVTGELLARFKGDSAVRAIHPESFTINKETFIDQLYKVVGLVDFHMYFSVVYDGKTKVLKNINKQLVSNFLPRNGSLNNGYNRVGTNSELGGMFQTTTDYYILKSGIRTIPKFINLAKSAVLAALPEQSEKLAARLPEKTLTPDEVSQGVMFYDSLMEADRLNNTPLSIDSLFAKILHNKISYPSSARNQGIYGRVYAGFEIDEQGQIKNIEILSPDNALYRFDIPVRNALKSLPAVDTTRRGKYALPVSFVYVNAKGKPQTYVPVNRLSQDRLKGRNVLEELIVKAVVSKPVPSSQEVWGYYK